MKENLKCAILSVGLFYMIWLGLPILGRIVLYSLNEFSKTTFSIPVHIVKEDK